MVKKSINQDSVHTTSKTMQAHLPLALPYTGKAGVHGYKGQNSVELPP